MEQQASTTSLHRQLSPLAEDSFSRRDRAPADSPSLSPIISHATLQELANTPASEVSPPETPLSAYLLPYQYLFFVFPITLLFGSLFGTIGGNKPSYFSNKRNILNVLFVKNGWGWTSIVFLVYLAIVFGKALVQQEVQQQQQQQQNSGSIDVQSPQEQPHGDQALRTRTRSTAATQRDDQESSQSTAGIDQPAPGARAGARVPTDVILKALVRWVLATLYWWLISQWFFGPGLFDRLFVLTGGRCSIDGHWSQYHCRRIGGKWSGGVDISGHMFLLTHACLFLMEELSVFLNVPRAWTALKTRPSAKYAVLSAVGLCALWWWMLLMTSVYYHHLAEKLSGLFFGLLFWCCTYVTSYKVLPFPGMPDQAVFL